MKGIDFFFFGISIVKGKYGIITDNFIDELELFIWLNHIYDCRFSELVDFRFISKFWENEGAFFSKFLVDSKILFKVQHQKRQVLFKEGEH